MVRVTALTDPHASLDDDFGKSLHVFGDVHSLCTFSIEKALDISAEQSLMGMRAQAKAQQKANSDPMLRLLGGALLVGDRTLDSPVDAGDGLGQAAVY